MQKFSTDSQKNFEKSAAKHFGHDFSISIFTTLKIKNGWFGNSGDFAADWYMRIIVISIEMRISLMCGQRKYKYIVGTLMLRYKQYKL